MPPYEEVTCDRCGQRKRLMRGQTTCIMCKKTERKGLSVKEEQSEQTGQRKKKIVTLNFAKYPALYARLESLAKQEFRNIDQQIMSMLTKSERITDDPVAE